MNVSVVTWNIGNPSIERASKQIEWIDKINADIYILTEIKKSNGCRLIKDFLQGNGYNTIWMEPSEKFEYGVGMAIKFKFPIQHLHYEGFLPERVAQVKCSLTDSTEIVLIGTYVPSRDASQMKIEKKRKFINSFWNHVQVKMNKSMILGGDLNILEREHDPKYVTFKEWEYQLYDNLVSRLVDMFKLINESVIDYSWIGRTGNGYRYDHLFISKDLQKTVVSCQYDHTPRWDKLSDHAALISVLKL